MRHRVALTPEAEEDLLSIYRYVARAASVEVADRLLDRLEEACLGLDELAHRGRTPPELRKTAAADFLEVITSPYRIIYRLDGDTAQIHAVVDGRRDVRAFLAERLLR